MESIQELKNALIASEDVNGRSPDAINPALITVGKAEFDALMSRLEPSEVMGDMLVFLADLNRDLQLRRSVEVHKITGVTAFTRGWLHRTKSMWERFQSAEGK